MHQRHTTAYAITGLLFLLCVASPVNAVNWMCGVDLNGNGDVTDAGETASCAVLTAGELCTVDAATCTTSQSCPINGALTCSAGSCTDVAACTGSGSNWSCPLAGVPSTFTTQASCDAACTDTAQCVDLPPTCPTGPYPCMDNGGTFQCSATTCVDLDATPPVQTTIDDSMYVNDGAVDPASGACLDQIMIFAGRNMRCKEAGTQTAFQNCCNDPGEVINDSSGSASESFFSGDSITAIYDSMEQAFGTYIATASTAAAAAAAADTLMAYADPMTLSVAVLTVAVIDYLLMNCDQQSMETGVLNGSGFCYQTGRPCTESWPLAGCVQRARNYCCFNSKLARIVHQQGRPQLSTFNNVPADNCRGFTPEEFQYLDFSRIDLSEYLGDMDAAALINQADMNTTVNDFYNNIR